MSALLHVYKQEGRNELATSGGKLSKQTFHFAESALSNFQLFLLLFFALTQNAK